MRKHSLTVQYHVYQGLSELPDEDQTLLQEANGRLPDAYAPYSNFRVAAAVRLANGIIRSTTNQENASYGLSLCAEQNLLSTVGADFYHVAPIAMAIKVQYERRPIQHPVSPCGACRQVIREHEARHNQDIRIILQGMSEEIMVFDSVKDLLPFAFLPQDLI